MAAARPARSSLPGSADARVPCPLCGGLIHPIAGKCKHCKADLASFHAARAPATTPLPSLGAVGAPASPPPAGQVHWHPGRADAPTPPRGDASQPVLPPRPAQAGHAVEAEPRSGWRSWPVIVIALAMVAIVAAVALMVWPATARQGGESKHTVGAPPAPEHMDTAPNVTAPGAPHASAAPPDRDPWATPTPAPPVPSDDTTNLLDSLDPFASPPTGKPSPRNRLGFNAGPSIVLSMAVHVCRKAEQCADSVDIAPATTAMCDVLRKQPILPPRCPAAHRCLARIDAMTCDATDLDPRQAGALLNQLEDCSDATHC